MTIPSFYCFPRKNLSSPIILISNSPCISLEKFLHRFFISSTKNNIIYIYLNNKKIIFLMQDEQSFINFSSFKTFLSRKELSLSYQALRACFRPYRAFVSLKTWWRNVLFSKLGSCLTYTSSKMKQFKNANLTSIGYKIKPLYAAKASNILMASNFALGATVSSKLVLLLIISSSH